jgi:hypothetical protein
MSFKIESRFSPSVVRAAQSLEAIIALSMVAFDHPLRAKAHKSILNLTEDFEKRATSFSALNAQSGYEVQDCMREMQADRKRRAQDRRAARERREAEKQAALALIAA